MNINDSGLSPEALTKAVAMFYSGKSSYQIADRLGVGRGVIGGRFERAGVVRNIDPGWSAGQFDAATSKLFAERMAYGFSHVEAGASLGKSASASRRHAKILGLLPEEARSGGVASINAIQPMAAEGGLGPEARALICERHDDAHVAACLAQGGFEHYDFTTGWTLGPDGERRWPFTTAAIEAAKATVAGTLAGPWTTGQGEGRAA